MRGHSSFQSSAGIYQALLEQAACAGAVMLTRVLAAARQSLRESATRLQGTFDKDSLSVSVKLLDLHAPAMCERYPRALSDVFRRSPVVETRPQAMMGQELHLDQLQLMDDAQVQERVEIARALQHVVLKAEISLSELNTYVCALLGLNHVSAEKNPLCPESYINALHGLMAAVTVPPVVRTAWMSHLGDALGDALTTSYQEWTSQLRTQGVRPVGFSVVRSSEVSPSQSVTDSKRRASARQTEREIWTPEYRQTVLTLNKLRGLMTGELEPVPSTPMEAFARQFAREFESTDLGPITAPQDAGDSEFQSTVPAALDALREMHQVDEVVQRMEQRPAMAYLGLADDASDLSVRQQLMRQAKGVSEVLSLEVVSLMVENLTQDTRLPAPVRHVIEQVEPALLRLVLIDPRFFIDRQHPARRLLQEISGRALAFGSVKDHNFNAFLFSLQRYVSPLGSQSIEDAEPFAVALTQLLQHWSTMVDQDSIAHQIDSVVAVLGAAEERNFLAKDVAAEFRQLPGLSDVPAGIVDFVCGPWAQVVASAHLTHAQGAESATHYRELARALLWSAQPDLTRKNIGKLTKLVPKLLSGLRSGLQVIDYPSVKTSAFFDVLMKLHQYAFRPEAAPVPPLAVEEAPHLPDSDVWLAPAEVKASGFMPFPSDEDEEKLPIGVDAMLPAQASDGLGSAVSGTDNPVQAPDPEENTPSPVMTLGAWVELLSKDVWQRTQLSWISPHQTMYLFTSVEGKTQSMTRRMLNRMLDDGAVRVVSIQQNTMDDALDAVVQAAMINSLDDPQ